MTAADRLPHIRVISTPVANVILLRSIGSKLRSQYEDLLTAPLPESLHEMIRRMP